MKTLLVLAIIASLFVSGCQKTPNFSSDEEYKSCQVCGYGHTPWHNKKIRVLAQDIHEGRVTQKEWMTYIHSYEGSGHRGSPRFYALHMQGTIKRMNWKSSYTLVPPVGHCKKCIKTFIEGEKE